MIQTDKLTPYLENQKLIQENNYELKSDISISQKAHLYYN